ncbi:SPFH domain-containing protein [Aquimarina sp. 2201CG5-10]|uniref:SPFH domain-containing protein n=1 Tax=Aquimarina callyspongiae TaxID=3098150 RepID=UPI002AB43014|nr:SPFH domain-containing protein [Aquimarina sp. 2201CG5-10]MDY8136764.1 SPFH domain-containing protein [Aquimarina sp. 2201CG5-10]
MANFSGIITIVVIASLILILWYFLVILLFYKKITQGEAIVRTGLGGTTIVFDKGIFVLPLFHNLEKIDLTIKKIDIEKIGPIALICNDKKQVHLKASFFVRINKTLEDIYSVAQNFGSEHTYKNEEINFFFEAKFTESLKTIAYEFSSEELITKRQQFRDMVIKNIGTDHYGYIIDDCTIYDVEIMT